MVSNIIKQKILGEINTKLKELNSISCINAGGCGISALAIYKWMKKYGVRFKDIKVVFEYNNLFSIHKPTNYLHNQSALKSKNMSLEAPSHCYIELDGLYIDSEGIRDYITGQYAHSIPSLKAFISSINNIQSWNNLFDRSNIPRIEEKLSIDLSEIKY